MVNIQPNLNSYNYNMPVFKKDPTPQDLFAAENQLLANNSFSFVTKQLAKRFKDLGDQNAQDNQDVKAIYYYQEAIKAEPKYTPTYYNLAKLYKQNGNTNQAINTYIDLLKVKPDEVEAQTLIGQAFEEKNNLLMAKESYKQAIVIDPKYDFAQRSLKKVENEILAKTDPVKAHDIRKQVAQSNLRTALKMVNNHVSSYLTDALKDVEVSFDKTNSLAGHKNIAQYENYNNKIIVTDDYIWAAPEITAAYIIHEAVHAKDKDGLSSIMEEQNAYQESIEFWVAHNHGIKDPELDYAASLYKDNPQKLRDKVAQTYRSRDKSIPEFSPNHGLPPKQGFFSKIKNKIHNVS